MNHIFKGTVAPAFAPVGIGHHYINTAAKIAYTSVGTGSSSDWISSSGGIGDALVANPLSQFAATTSAQLAGVLSDKTGWATGALAVFSISPALTGSASIALGTITADAQALSITGAYNNAGVTFGGLIKANLTDTASNAASLLMDLQVGGSSKIKTDKSGNTTIAGPLFLPDGTASAPSIQFSSVPGFGFYKVAGSSQIALGISNSERMKFVSVAGGGSIAITASNNTASFIDAGGSVGIQFWKDADYTLGIRNSTNPMTVNVYGTSATSNADYVRGSLSCSTTAFTIAAQGGGAYGSANLDLILSTKGTGKYQLRDGANAQSVYIYNTYNGTNDEFGVLSFSTEAGVFTVGTRQTGTGAGRDVKLLTSGSVRVASGGGDRWSFNNSGHFLAWSDNAYDIGASGANRPRHGYFGGTLKTGDPTGGTAQTWKLGSKTAGAVTLDSANYVQVEINGVAVKLLIAT